MIHFPTNSKVVRYATLESETYKNSTGSRVIVVRLFHLLPQYELAKYKTMTDFYSERINAYSLSANSVRKCFKLTTCIGKA